MSDFDPQKRIAEIRAQAKPTINTLEDAARHLINVGAVDMETMQVEGKQLLDACGYTYESKTAAMIIKRQIEKHHFLEGSDFTTAMLQSNGGRPATSFMFTMNAANHVLLAAMTKEGKAARQEAINDRTQPQLPAELANDPIIAVRMEQIKQSQRIASIEDKISHMTSGAPIGWFVLTRIGEYYGFSKQKAKAIAAEYDLPTRPITIGDYPTITHIVREADFKQALAQEMKETRLINKNWFESPRLGRYAAKGRFLLQFNRKVIGEI